MLRLNDLKPMRPTEEAEISIYPRMVTNKVVWRWWTVGRTTLMLARSLPCWAGHSRGWGSPGNPGATASACRARPQRQGPSRRPRQGAGQTRGSSGPRHWALPWGWGQATATPIHRSIRAWTGVRINKDCERAQAGLWWNCRQLLLRHGSGRGWSSPTLKWIPWAHRAGVVGDPRWGSSGQFRPVSALRN